LHKLKNENLSLKECLENLQRKKYKLTKENQSKRERLESIEKNKMSAITANEHTIKNVEFLGNDYRDKNKKYNEVEVKNNFLIKIT